MKQNPFPKPCEVRGAAVDASMIELTLKDNTRHTESPPRILQKDKTLPAARNCPYSYAIEQVYYYENNLAVFLVVHTPGFPGSTRRYMVATGGIDDENIE